MQWRHAPADYIAHVLVALTVILTLASRLGHLVKWWFAAVLAVTLLRAVLSYSYFSTPAQRREPRYWGMLIIGLTL